MAQNGDNTNGNGENAIVKVEAVELEVYGARDVIKELADRITVMLPSVKELGREGAWALAQASMAMELNPFIGELWAIPQKGGTYTIMPGIKGIRRKAHEQAARDGGYYAVSFRHATEEEIEGLRINDGDIVRACDVVVITDKTLKFYKYTEAFPRYTGFGVYRNGESTKMNPLQVARKRAEAEALKQAFDLPMPFATTAAADPGLEIDETQIERMNEYDDPRFSPGYEDANAAAVDADQAQAELFDL